MHRFFPHPTPAPALVCFPTNPLLGRKFALIFHSLFLHVVSAALIYVPFGVGMRHYFEYESPSLNYIWYLLKGYVGGSILYIFFVFLYYQVCSSIHTGDE